MAGLLACQVVISGFGLVVGKRHVFSVPRNSYNFPDRCALCLSPRPKSFLRLRSEVAGRVRSFWAGHVYEYLTLKVPFCDACAGRQTRWRIVGICWLLIVLAGTGAALVRFDVGRLEECGVWVLAGLVGFVPSWLISRQLGVHLDSYTNDTLYFSFKSAEYAREFAAVNKMVEAVIADGQRVYRSSQKA